MSVIFSYIKETSVDVYKNSQRKITVTRTNKTHYWWNRLKTGSGYLYLNEPWVNFIKFCSYNINMKRKIYLKTSVNLWRCDRYIYTYKYMTVISPLIGGWWGQGIVRVLTCCKIENKNKSSHTYIYIYTYGNIYIYIYIYILSSTDRLFRCKTTFSFVYILRYGILEC